MVTTEHEASTLDEFQVPNLTEVRHRGYCYFPIQENPWIATQSTISVVSTETHVNYLLSFNIDTESAAVFTTSASGQQAFSFPSDELICEQIAGGFYTILSPMQTPSYHEVFNTFSIDISQISSQDLEIEKNAINLFDAYRQEEFDTDIAYEFTNDLDIFIRTNSESAIRIINNLISKQALDEDITFEILKALGRIEDANTKEQRYQLLMSFIKDDSAIIRDAAVSGLSFLDDKRALPQLRILFETETVPILKNNIKVAIKGLETY